jgi:hypothetical protein
MFLKIIYAEKFGENISVFAQITASFLQKYFGF